MSFFIRITSKLYSVIKIIFDISYKTLNHNVLYICLTCDSSAQSFNEILYFVWQIKIEWLLRIAEAKQQ